MSSGSAARAHLRQLEKQFYAQFDLPDDEKHSFHHEGGSNDETDSSTGGSEQEDKQKQLPKEAKHTRAHLGTSEAMIDTEEDEENSEKDSEYQSDTSNNEDLDDEEDLLETAMQPTISKTAKSMQPRRAVETVVFQDTPRASPAQMGSGEARKNFMRINAQDSAKPVLDSQEDAGEEEDMRANDRKLAELLSTSLFAPGSGKDKRKLTSTTNETLARIHELSTSDTLQPHAAGSGWGEQQLRAKELGKMPARIRSGLRRAAGERREREIETQKELGLWNPRYQNQAQISRGSATERGTRITEPKKRMRGIGSGVGSFRNGTLHLSQADVRRIQGPKRGSTKRRPPK